MIFKHVYGVKRNKAGVLVDATQVEEEEEEEEEAVVEAVVEAAKADEVKAAGGEDGEEKKPPRVWINPFPQALKEMVPKCTVTAILDPPRGTFAIEEKI